MASVLSGDIVAYAFVSVVALFWCWTAGALLMVHTYALGRDALVISRRILWSVPGGRVRIPYDNIQSIEISHSLWVMYGAPFYRQVLQGIPPFSNESVVLRLKRRHHHLFSRVILTPENVGEFINRLSARSGAPVL